MANPFFRRRGNRMPARETAPPSPMFTGRPNYEGNFQAGMVTLDMSHRYWRASRFGIDGAVSTLPDGRWSRGHVLRFLTPDLCPTLIGFYMYDPTKITPTPGTPLGR